MRPLDIRSLRSLVTAAKQHDQKLPAPNEIDTVSRPMIDPQLADATTDGTSITRMPESQAINTHGNHRLATNIRESRKGLSLLNFEHAFVSHRIQIVNKSSPSECDLHP